MKGLTFILSLISLNAFASEPVNCRLAIHDMDKLIGNNNQLSDMVHEKLESKNISLINENELIEGDFHIPRLIAVYNGKPNIPMHKYLFKSKTKIGLVPCVAFPLCSPVYTEKQVTDISGIKYKHDYSIDLVTSKKSKEIIHTRFSHTYKGELESWKTEARYDGTQEQEDLALKIADDIPQCSKLLKAARKD